MQAKKNQTNKKLTIKLASEPKENLIVFWKYALACCMSYTLCKLHKIHSASQYPDNQFVLNMHCIAKLCIMHSNIVKWTLRKTDWLLLEGNWSTLLTFLRLGNTKHIKSWCDVHISPNTQNAQTLHHLLHLLSNWNKRCKLVTTICYNMFYLHFWRCGNQVTTYVAKSCLSLLSGCHTVFFWSELMHNTCDTYAVSWLGYSLSRAALFLGLWEQVQLVQMNLF